MSTTLQSITNIDYCITQRDQKRGAGLGTSYTEIELLIAELICKIVLNKHQIIPDFSPTESEQKKYKAVLKMVEHAEESVEDKNNIGQIIRTSYRYYEAHQLEIKRTIDAFPKVDERGDRIERNNSSLIVMFRQVLRNHVSKDKVDEIFKVYPPKKKFSRMKILAEIE